MPRVLQPDSPLPLTAALLRLPAARAFGASADAAHLPPDNLTLWLSAPQLSGSCLVCYMSASGGITTAPAAPAAPALPVALVLTAASGLPCPDFSSLPRQRAQSACAAQRAQHCTLGLSTRAYASRPTHALHPRLRSPGPSPGWRKSARGCPPYSP